MSRLWSKAKWQCGVLRKNCVDVVLAGSVSTHTNKNLKWLRSLYLIEIRVYFIDIRLTEVSLLDHLWAIGGGWQFGDIGRDALGRNWLKGRIRPVLKHGPRSLTCMRIEECETREMEWKRTGGNPSDRQLLVKLLCLSLHDGTRKMLN